MKDFSEFNFIDDVMKSIKETGYEKPTPIQEQAIPYLFEGKDLLGIAQTGTGKTAAFSLPIINKLGITRTSPPGTAKVRVLVITPTRELATQIHLSFKKYGKYLNLFTSVVFGGVKPYAQIKTLKMGVDVLVATPGRLLDLISQCYIQLDCVHTFVLDEADRLLDMGFKKDISKIIKKLPLKRQTLLFSATMPKDIAELAGRILIKPVRVEVTPQASTVDIIDQKVYFVEKANKSKLLKEMLLKKEGILKTLVFTRTKYGADRLVKKLKMDNIDSVAIHGDKTQNAREKALDKFKRGTVPILIATDIAARGLDVPNISHVFNYDLPTEPANYVHRIGRTARAGKDGIAFTFCDESERKLLKAIEKTIGLKVAVDIKHPYHVSL